MIYCYRNCDNVVEEVFKMGTAPETIIVEGKTYNRSFRDERVAVKVKRSQHCGLDMGLGVMPKQIPEAERVTASKGFPTKFTATGDAIITSEIQHKKLADMRLSKELKETINFKKGLKL